MRLLISSVGRTKKMLHTRYFVADMFSLQTDWLNRGKQLIGSALAPLQTYKWRRFISSYSALADIESNSPHFASRIHKPYLVEGLGCAERASLLMTHYRLAITAGLGSLMRKASLQPLPVCDITGKSGMRYQIILSAADRHRPDGEFVLRLKIGNASIYTAAFSLVEEQGRMQIRLGGLHGLLATDDALRIKNVTRDFFGWRPKDMMVAIVREIGGRLGCACLILTGNGNRLPIPEKRICKKSSDYDRTWKEMNAVARADGDFELPCIASHASPHRHEESASQCPPSLKEKFRQTILNEVGNFILHERHA